MNSGHGIFAGTVDDIRPDSGDWLIIDMGFSQKGKTCGVILPDDQALLCTFAEMRAHVEKEARSPGLPLNLLIEAPLSVAFNNNGNPSPRSPDVTPLQRRDWYYNAGVGMQIASMYLLRGLSQTSRERDIRLFEGFVSFKSKKTPHLVDAHKLKAAIYEGGDATIYGPEELKRDHLDALHSAFAVAGLEFGIPPVIMA